ncbi:MAG: TonB family protein [Hyphomicrobium sp.]|nr:TonB family protein [Hyphomicrobium sp.]
MTNAVAALQEATPRKALRWSSAFLFALSFHGLVIATILLAVAEQEPEDGALVMLDLPPLSVESTSTEPENSEDAQDTTTAPPPSDAEDDSLLPDEAEQKPENEPPPPEPVLEKAEVPESVDQLVEELVPEAPNAPEPEVVLPKLVEQSNPVKAPEKVQPETKKPVVKKKVDPKPETDRDGKKAGPKFNSKAASAAATNGGKFSPNAISRPHPPYPSTARASRIEGSVVVRYTVSPSGSVTGVSVLSASPPGVFNSVTVAAVRNWRFRPSSSGGSGTTTIRFKLR